MTTQPSASVASLARNARTPNQHRVCTQISQLRWRPARARRAWRRVEASWCRWRSCIAGRRPSFFRMVSCPTPGGWANPQPFFASYSPPAIDPRARAEFIASLADRPRMNYRGELARNRQRALPASSAHEHAWPPRVNRCFRHPSRRVRCSRVEVCYSARAYVSQPVRAASGESPGGQTLHRHGPGGERAVDGSWGGSSLLILGVVLFPLTADPGCATPMASVFRTLARALHHVVDSSPATRRPM